ncbi:MAG: M48 family metallopeptidase [Chloroflexota bacterium]|nr:M48 family metallopeptidase [Chloroflexota bacterium]
MFEQISANKNKSIVLVIVMGALLLGIGYAIGEVFFDSGVSGIILASIVWLIMNLVAFSQGDQVFLAISKAKKIDRGDYPQLYNVVEEMKIASGLPVMPDIYIIDDPAPNAFATGRNPNKSAIAVTSGLMRTMNRDELQGVIAHEMGHIKNRDVMLMVISGILMGAIVLLADMAMWYLILGGGRGGRRSSGGGGGGAEIIILIVGVALIILAPILARLLYFAMSRKREYLADASSAQYTRYPEGLASALEKLSSSTAVLKSANRVTAPMYIINPMHKAGIKASDLTSTHPPISERIRILRGMAGGASFADYDKAFRQTHKSNRGVIPGSALAGAAGLVGVRQAAAEDKAGEKREKLNRSREVSSVIEKLNKYTALACECGTAFRVPQEYKGKSIRCPRCGRDNPIPDR